MCKRVLNFFLFCVLLGYQVATAQQISNKEDTFFLAKKKGWLGKLGKSMATTPPDELPKKIENQFLQYKGKIIRSIQLVQLGFENSIADTHTINNSFGVRLANALHKSSTDNVIRHNLFFKEGSIVYPYLLADNERYLRTLSYIQDAKIVVNFIPKNTDSVDVVVLTKDVFSIGGKLKVDDRTRGRVELQEDNFVGSGTKLFFSALYDEARHPPNSLAAQITKRNIRGSFVDFTTGFSNFANSLSSGRREETNFFMLAEKPLVTPYIPLTGSLQAGYYGSSNAYVSDSLYQSDSRYKYYNIDGWVGYSLDNKKRLYAHKEIRLHKFVAIRIFNQHFFNIPDKYQTQYDYRFTNFTGTLASINIFKQTFYKTNFIYGFGVSEDIPEGFNIALTAGFIKKQLLKRPYTGLDINFSNFKKRGLYSNFTLRVGGFFNQNHFEDANLLFNVDHFTLLKKLNSHWYQRSFISTGLSTQIHPVLNSPLLINSIYGLPYFSSQNINADFRATVKLETVFYNTNKFLGFRFAPFMFADGCFIKPTKDYLSKSSFYSAIGGGIRTRNENLVFGTIELKIYYFPRINGDMTPWSVDLNSDLRFKYNSTFIKRPDYVSDN